MMWLMLLLACDDALFEGHSGAGGVGTTAAEGWCGVQQVLATCTACHSAGGALGGLDLETDPHTALVDVTSAAYGVVLVAPGDPDGSLLVRKLEGTQGASEGGEMPPGGGIDAASVALVRQWVADGASADCATEPTLPTATGVHPDGWEAPEEHGMAFKFQSTTDCRDCHGEQLEGDVGPSCTSCHGEGWETTCTFCHGGVDDASGAPPEGIDDSTDRADQVFIPHNEHLTAAGSVPHADIACTTCHDVPTSALQAGHILDDATAGQAETAFSGLATGATWDGAGCTVYCHGDGQTVGDIEHSDGPRDCRSCHPDQTNDAGWRGMSGRHEDHLDEGFVCAECHGGVVSPGGAIVDASLHVDGQVSLALPITWNNGTCTGTCHGETHNGRTW